MQTVSRRDTTYVLLVALAVLAVARLLTPNEAGYGTHRGLMMPPCLFHTLTGVPCPLCGLTTASARAIRGDVIGSFEAHVLGPAVLLATIVVASVSLLALVWEVPVLQRAVATLYGAKVAYWLLVLVLVAWPINAYLSLVGKS